MQKANFIREIQARLGSGWIDTRAERIFWRMVRLFRRRNRALTFLLVAGMAQVAETQGMPTYDNANLQHRIYQFSADGIRANLATLWKETRDNQRWATDVVQSYRNIKMAKSAYESLATFDLTQNLSVLDILPEVDLPEGYYFGGSQNGFSSTPTKDTYVSLRFKTRPGGMASTFTNWAKFQPKLKIDVNQLAGQLANLDFDAVQMVQHKNASGNAIGAAMEKGDARNAVRLRLGFWDTTIQQYNDFLGQKQLEEETSARFQQQIAIEQTAFEQNAQNLQQRLDMEDDALRRRLQGSNGANMPSTYDVMYAPKVKFARELLQAQQSSNRAKLKEMWDGLTALKKTEETRQAAILGDVEVTKLMAEMNKVTSESQTTFTRILEKYKIKREDKGEGVGAGVLGMLTLKSDDMKDMKLPEPAQQEIMRNLQATSQALATIQIKMQALQSRSASLVTVDKVTKDLHDMTVALSNAYKISANEGLSRVANTLNQLDGAYLQQWNTREEQRRAEDVAASQAVWEGFNEANQKYFKYLFERKPLSAASLVENLSKSYFSFVKTYFGKQSIAEVMGPRYDQFEDDMQKEQDLYNSLSN